jgi:hypothetical protein
MHTNSAQCLILIQIQYASDIIRTMRSERYLPNLVIHGGAGGFDMTIPGSTQLLRDKKSGLHNIAKEGFKKLMAGATAREVAVFVGQSLKITMLLTPGMALPLERMEFLSRLV